MSFGEDEIEGGNPFPFKDKTVLCCPWCQCCLTPIKEPCKFKFRCNGCNKIIKIELLGDKKKKKSESLGNVESHDWRSTEDKAEHYQYMRRRVEDERPHHYR